MRPKDALFNIRRTSRSLGWDPALTTLPYGDQFNKHRKMHQSYLSQNRVEDCKPIKTREARTLLRNLVGSPPEKYDTFLSRYEFPVISFPNAQKLSAYQGSPQVSLPRSWRAIKSTTMIHTFACPTWSMKQCQRPDRPVEAHSISFLYVGVKLSICSRLTSSYVHSTPLSALVPRRKPCGCHPHLETYLARAVRIFRANSQSAKGENI